MNKQILEQMKTDLSELLTEYGNKYNADVNFGSISIDENAFSFRTNVILKTAQNPVKDERQFFKERCKAFGLLPTDYLYEFRIQTKPGEKAEVFELIGFDLINDEQPIKARNIRTQQVMNFETDVIADIHDKDIAMVSNKIKEPPKLIKRNKK